jgi:hypothetical protein
MVVLGLLLMGLGVVAVVAALFTAEGTVELLGTDISALTMFLAGLGAGLAILWGFGFSKWGTRRTLRHRRESRRLSELSEQLERRENERREDEQDREDRSF